MSGKEDNKPTGPRFSWKKAGNLLSEVEKNRICCLLLTCFEQIKPTGEDFELAAAQFGAAKGGFAKMYQTTIKKLKDNNAYIVDGEDVSAIPTPEATPAAKKGGRPAKRKVSETPAAEGEEIPATPSKKPRAAPKKKAAGKKADSSMAEVKDEATGEGVRSNEATPEAIVESIEKD